jgi:transposase
MRPDAMASGWRAGCGRAVSRPTSSPASIAVSREHRRAKTDRLDTELLIRVFLGWLRGEKRHCSMVAIPTVEQEDARRPNRERGNLVTEQTRIVNQIKAVLVRFGIRTFRPTLRKAEEKLESLRTTEGAPLLENTRAELGRYLARLRVVREQIAKTWRRLKGENQLPKVVQGVKFQNGIEVIKMSAHHAA